jgi:hypothetical protein
MVIKYVSTSVQMILKAKIIIPDNYFLSAQSFMSTINL